MIKETVFVFLAALSACASGQTEIHPTLHCRGIYPRFIVCDGGNEMVWMPDDAPVLTAPLPDQIESMASFSTRPIDVLAILVEADSGECFQTFEGCAKITHLDGSPATANEWWGGHNGDFKLYRWSCTDTANVLWTAEDGEHWCHKVQP